MPGSRTGAISVGARASAAFGAARQRSGHIRIGLLVAASSPAWAGRAQPREKVDWIPPAHVPITLDGKTINPVWYRFFREIADVRLGGVAGQTVPQVATTVTQTQSELVATQVYAQQVGVYAEGLESTINATVQVAQNSGLTGATSIPPSPEPPPRYSGGSSVA